MAPAETETVTERIVEKVEELHPRQGWPDYGALIVKIVFHQGKVAGVEGRLESVSKKTTK